MEQDIVSGEGKKDDKGLMLSLLLGQEMSMGTLHSVTSTFHEKILLGAFKNVNGIALDVNVI